MVNEAGDISLALRINVLIDVLSRLRGTVPVVLRNKIRGAVGAGPLWIGTVICQANALGVECHVTNVANYVFTLFSVLLTLAAFLLV